MGYKSGYQDDEENWPAWRPILGIFITVVLLLGSAASPRGSMPTDMAGLAGYTLGSLLLVYGIPYYFAFRRTHIAWKITAFIIIASLALLVNMAKAGREIGTFRDDMKSLRGDMQSVVDGNQVAGGGATDTPAGVMRNFFAALQKNQKDYEAKMLASGVNDLLDPAALRRNPAILKDCGTTERLRGDLARHRSVTDALIADTRTKIQHLHGNRDVREGMLEGFDESMANNSAEVSRRWALADQNLVEMGTMCRILARRNWRPSGDTIGFTNDRDMNEYNAAGERYDRAYQELAALEAKAQARARESIREMDRL